MCFVQRRKVRFERPSSCLSCPAGKTSSEAVDCISALVALCPLLERVPAKCVGEYSLPKPEVLQMHRRQYGVEYGKRTWVCAVICVLVVRSALRRVPACKDCQSEPQLIFVGLSASSANLADLLI